MKLGTKLTWWFMALLSLALIFVVALAYHEMVLETNNPQAWGEEAPEPVWWQFCEVVMRSFIPLALLGAGGWWLTIRALRPLQTLTETISHIHSGNLKERIPLTGRGDELDQLTAVFNDMTSRLEASFDRIHEFTLHASHELKTPLAILRADFGELVDEPGQSEANRERFASHLDEIERLTRIVNGLTLLTRADAEQITLKREQVALEALVGEALDNTRALAEPRELTVAIESLQGAQIQGDRHRLRQLLLILCDNAVKFNRPGGEVIFSLTTNPSSATVRVQNTGPEIPPDEQPHIFERFRRGSHAAAADIEGCGLGLSIALWIAQAHGGSLTFTSQPEKTEFVLTLPLSPTP